jgi:hypothetical protein
MIPAVRIEWQRLRSRLDIYVALLLFAVLVLVRQTLAITSIASMSFPRGATVPPEVYALQAEQLAGYALPTGIGTVVIDAFPFLLLVAGFLVCWTLGGEFSSGTLRTSLVANPERAPQLLSHLVGAFFLTVLALSSIIIVAFAMTWAAPVLNIHLEPKAWSVDLDLVLFAVVAALSAMLPISLAAFITTIVKSPVGSIVAFGAVLAVASFAGQLDLPESVEHVLPGQALLTLLEGSAPIGSLMPSGGGLIAEKDPSTALALIAVAIWTMAFLLAALVTFRYRDVSD